MFIRLQSTVALFTCGCLMSVASSPSNVGFIVTNGEARVDGSLVRGNSTLFNGGLVQAGNSTSDLMFPGGSNLLLQPDSAVKVYEGYAVLQHGGVIEHGPQRLVVSGLRIAAVSAQGSFAVGMKDATNLQVTARDGATEVRNGAGELVAHLEPGKAFSFAIQDAQQEEPARPTPQISTTPLFGPGSQSQQITIHGILRKDHAGSYGHYLVTDEASKTTYQLQGNGLDDLVGAAVEATGTLYDTTPAEGASKVLSVSDVHQLASNETPSAPETSAPAEAAAPPAPAGETTPPASAGTEAPPATSAPASTEDATVPQPPPLVVHSDTAKVVIIVALAAGAAVGVALGLAGGKTSTVSPE